LPDQKPRKRYWANPPLYILSKNSFIHTRKNPNPQKYFETRIIIVWEEDSEY